MFRELLCNLLWFVAAVDPVNHVDTSSCCGMSLDRPMHGGLSKLPCPALSLPAYCSVLLACCCLRNIIIGADVFSDCVQSEWLTERLVLQFCLWVRHIVRRHLMCGLSLGANWMYIFSNCVLNWIYIFSSYYYCYYYLTYLLNYLLITYLLTHLLT